MPRLIAVDTATGPSGASRKETPMRVGLTLSAAALLAAAAISAAPRSSQ